MRIVEVVGKKHPFFTGAHVEHFGLLVEFDLERLLWSAPSRVATAFYFDVIKAKRLSGRINNIDVIVGIFGVLSAGSNNLVAGVVECDIEGRQSVVGGGGACTK